MISGRNYGQQQNHLLMLDYLAEYIVWQDMPGETLSGQQACVDLMLLFVNKTEYFRMEPQQYSL